MATILAARAGNVKVDAETANVAEMQSRIVSFFLVFAILFMRTVITYSLKNLPT